MKQDVVEQRRGAQEWVCQRILAACRPVPAPKESLANATARSQTPKVTPPCGRALLAAFLIGTFGLGPVFENRRVFFALEFQLIWFEVLDVWIEGINIPADLDFAADKRRNHNGQTQANECRHPSLFRADIRQFRKT